MYKLRNKNAKIFRSLYVAQDVGQSTTAHKLRMKVVKSDYRHQWCCLAYLSRMAVFMSPSSRLQSLTYSDRRASINKRIWAGNTEVYMYIVPVWDVAKRKQKRNNSRSAVTTSSWWAAVVWHHVMHQQAASPNATETKKTTHVSLIYVSNDLSILFPPGIVGFILVRRIEIDHVTCLSCQTYVLMNITWLNYSLKCISRPNTVVSSMQ